MRLVRESNGQRVTLDVNSPLGTGGEARVFALSGIDRYCIKIYHHPSEGQARKLGVMVENPPDIPVTTGGHQSIAWPIDILRYMYGGHGFAGFIMPRVFGMRPLFNIYNPMVRRKETPLFTYDYLYAAAQNTAWAMRSLHNRDYVIGDVNESNILVKETGLVTLVDSDSFQVHDGERNLVYRCPVGKPDYTPPELQNTNFRQVDRRPEHDLFGLAALIFQLLMEGTHPFSGIYQGSGDPPPYSERIQAGHYTYGSRTAPYRPMPLAPPIDILPPTLRNLFERCFIAGHRNPAARPDAAAWSAALKEASSELQVCSQNRQHKYGSHLRHCPWCERTERLGGRDPFPLESQEPVKRTPRPSPQRRRVQQPAAAMAHAGRVAVAVLTAPSPAAAPSNIPSWPLAPTAIPLSASLPVMPKAPDYHACTWLAACMAIIAPLLPGFHFFFGALAAIFGLAGARYKMRGRYVALVSGIVGIITMASALYGVSQQYLLRPDVRLLQKNGSIRSLAFSPDGGILAVATGRNEDQRLIPGEISLYNPDTGVSQQSITGRGDMASVAFSPNGRWMGVGTDSVMTSAEVMIWNAHTLRQEELFTGFQGDVDALAFSSDSRYLATGCRNGDLDVWSLATKSISTQVPEQGEVFGAAFSPDGRLIAAATGSSASGRPGHVSVYDLAHGRPLWTHRAHSDRALSVAFTPDGKTLVSCGDDAVIHIWNSENGKTVKLLFANDLEALNAIALSPDGYRAITGSNDGSLRLWNLQTGKQIYKLSPKELKRQGAGSLMIQAVAYDPDGKYLAGGSASGDIVIWRSPKKG